MSPSRWSTLSLALLASLTAVESAGGCWSTSDLATQKQVQCHTWCSSTIEWQGPHALIFSDWCGCQSEARAATDTRLSPFIPAHEYQWAVHSIASSGGVPPLASLITLLDSVSHNAEQSLIKHGWSAERVLAFFASYGNIGTEPEQILAYVRALHCAKRPPRHSEVGLFQGHSAALFMAATANVGAQYTVIDPLEFPFSVDVLRFLRERYPRRTLTSIKGRSDRGHLNATRNPIIADCDVWSIDGSHTVEIVATDVRNALIASPAVGTILTDDITDHVTNRERDQRGTGRKCSTAVNAWDVAGAKAGGLLHSRGCSFAGLKYGTPKWCSAWCIGSAARSSH